MGAEDAFDAITASEMQEESDETTPDPRTGRMNYVEAFDPEELATRYGPSPTVSARVRALHIAFNAAMLEGDWPYARGLGASLILGREAAFGTAYHPRVGLDLVTLAGVAAEAGDYFAAKETLHKAQEILEITCGKNSKLFKDTLVLYDRIVEVETERTMTPTTPSPMPPLVDNKAN